MSTDAMRPSQPLPQPEVAGWARRPQTLVFLASYWELYSVRFYGYVLTNHCLDVGNVSFDPEYYWQLLPPDCDAVFNECLVPEYQKLLVLTFTKHCIRYVPVQFDRCFVELNGTFEEYRKKFSAKSRKNLNRELKAFAEYSGGKIAFRVYKTSEEIVEYHQLAVALSEKTYQAHEYGGIDASPAFQRKLVKLALNDQARGYLLFLKDAPIAYVYCQVNGSALMYLKVGYDLAFAKWSPGTILLHRLIEHLFAEGRFRVLDFCEGEFHYKRFFSTRVERCCRAYYFRRTARLTTLVLAHAGFNWLTSIPLRCLDKLGWKERITKALQRFTAN